MSTGGQDQQNPQQSQSQQAGTPSPDPARPLAAGEVPEGQAVRNTGNPAAVQRTGRQAAGRVPQGKSLDPRGRAVVQQPAGQGQQAPAPFQASGPGQGGESQQGQAQQAQAAPDLNALRDRFEAELEARLGSGQVLPAAAPGAPQPQQLSFEQLRPYAPLILQIIQDLLSAERDAAR
jgi:hypothetical protein